MDLLEDLHRLRSLFARDTTELPEYWQSYRPSIGHCHIASIVIFRRWGGKIQRGNARSQQGLSTVTHYWNNLDGITLDATRDQFPENTWFCDVVDATGEPLNQTTLDKLRLLERRFYSETSSETSGSQVRKR